MDIKQDKKKNAVDLKPEKVHKLWISTFLILAIAGLALYFLLQLHALDIIGKYRPILLRWSLAGTIIFSVLAISQWLEKKIRTGDQARAIRYNLLRVVKLLTILVIILIVISFIYKNWYTAAVSLGFFSLILGFALQSPISSLIAWLYIVLRLPYKVGDRIQINDFTGDVVEIGYLDTTLWEFGGIYMTNDLPTGRLIRFPNSLVLQMAVFNYSWQKFPYIWNEIPFYVSYQANMDEIQTIFREVANDFLGREMADDVVRLKQYIKETAVDELDIKDYPFVHFRTHENTWIEVLLIYLTEPKRASSIRSGLIKNVLVAMGKAGIKNVFPNENNR